MVKQTSLPSLAERIKEIRAACDKLIDDHVTALKAQYDGIPYASLRREIELAAWGCPCSQALHLMTKLEGGS